MRKSLERYLEVKRLLSETAAVVKDHPNSIIREGALEVAHEAVRIAEEQLEAALIQSGLPSIEAQLGSGRANEAFLSNEGLTQKWLQEKADQDRRAQFVRWNGKLLRARPQAKNEGPISMPPPRGYDTSQGM